MSLSFLTPLLLGGAALIAVPVIIHLILRQKPKHLLFPAFRFLQQKHRTTVQKLRLRHFLLLALRIGLILLLCAALARPELSGGPESLGDDSPVAVVLVFDTSPSMEYAHEGKSRLEAAKEQALTTLKDLPGSSQAAVFDTAEPGGQFVGLPDAVKQVQNRRIQAYQRPVTASVEEALRLLTREPPTLPLLMMVFSDRTAASWNAEAVGSVLRRAKERLEEKLPAPLAAYYVDLGVREPRNVAIQGLMLKLENQVTPLEQLPVGGLADESFQIQASVRITGTSVDSELLLYVDGQLKDAKRLKGSAMPGQTSTETVVFKPIPRTAAVMQGDVRLKNNDALESDNVRYWTLSSMPRKVLILADEPKDAQEWRFALESSPLPLTCTVLRPKDVPGNLNPDQHETVCLLNVAQPDSELWELLRRYVADGGGLVVLPGEDSQPDAYGTDAALALMPARLVKKLDVPPPRAWLAPTDYEHPIMDKFKSWEKQALPGRISRYWQIEPLSDSYRSVLPLNYHDAGKLQIAPVLAEKVFNRERIHGRVILYTTAMYLRADWKEGWNNFLDLGGNWLGLALPYLSVRHVLGAREERQNLMVGEEPRFWLPRNAGLTSYQLTGPQNATGEIKDKDTQAVVSDARRPGNSRVAAGDVWTRSFSLNLPPIETNLLTGGPSSADIEALLGSGSYHALADSVDVQKLAFARLGRVPKRELLPYLMIAVLVFLALENLLANRFYEREKG
jgi:hypothetical protein